MNKFIFVLFGLSLFSCGNPHDHQATQFPDYESRFKDIETRLSILESSQELLNKQLDTLKSSDIELLTKINSLNINFNSRIDSLNTEINNTILALKLQLNELDSNIDDNLTNINDEINALITCIYQHSKELDEVRDLISQNQDNDDVLLELLANIETRIVDINDTLNKLKIDSNIEFINPCGGTDPLDEILVKTSKGIFAYFEQYNNRRLVKLPPGNYTTTDTQRCDYKVTTNNTVTWGN